MEFTIQYASDKEILVKKHIVKYSEDGHEFRFYATCIAPSREAQLPVDALTLMMCHGLGLNIETYYPMIRYLYAMQDNHESPIRIRAIWLLEHANHNDSALLNEQILKQHYTGLFPIQYYAHGIVSFLKSGLINLHDPFLIPIAHCGGSGALVLALDMISRYYRMHPRCVILIEPMLFDRRIESDFAAFTKRVRGYNRKREHVWQNINEAMAYHLKRSPWAEWDLDVLRWLSRTGFRMVPNDVVSGGKPWVTWKTPVQQESASFEFEGPLIAADILLELFSIMPVHVIMAEKQNMWSKPMYANQTELLAKHKPQFASFRVIPEAGHCAPQENVSASAVAVFDALLQERSRYAAAQAASAPAQTAKL